MIINSGASAIALTNYNGGYTSGYELINGSNETAGGFIVTGTISLVNNIYKINIQFSFNDVIDPNPIYRRDSDLAFLSAIAGYACKKL